MQNKMMSMSMNILTAVLMLGINFWLASPGQCQVVQAKSVDMTRLAAFDEAQLGVVSEASERSFVAPALGRIMRLDTRTKPKSSASMETVFHIYTEGKVTRDVEFRARSPAPSISGEDFLKLDPSAAFQYDLNVLAASEYDATKRTIIMIPGYMSSDEVDWGRVASEYWLHIFDDSVNLIIVGWHDSNGPLYEHAVANTVLVARQVTVLLHYLAQLGGTSVRDQSFLDRLNLIGHSLGAHIAGFVGRDLGGRVARIIGLDPAGPTFDSLPDGQRLARSNAQLVEVLHTNAGRMAYSSLLPGVLTRTIPSLVASAARGQFGLWFGTSEQLGHIDYYANDGHTQEGCSGLLHACDHNRAAQIYVDMLKHEFHLKSAGISSGPAYKQNRLWAFRALDYEEFQSGFNLEQLCPQLVEPVTHLNPLEVAKTFDKCAVPLLDLCTPTLELIRELRDKFHIDFNVNSKSTNFEQPRFYFKTQQNSRDSSSSFVADSYLLKVYLDARTTNSGSSECPLKAEMRMQGGEMIRLELDKHDSKQMILSAPFAHPAGPEAHVDRRELLASAPSQNDQASEHFASLFQKLFPAKISLEYEDSRSKNCRFVIQQVEVAPVSVDSASNIGALYGAAAASASARQGDQLKVVNTRQLGVQLATIMPSGQFAQVDKYELKLDAVLISAL